MLEETFTPLNLFTFDAVWILADALDRLLDSVNGLLDVENGSLVLNEDNISLQDILVNGMTVRKKIYIITKSIHTKICIHTLRCYREYTMKCI